MSRIVSYLKEHPEYLWLAAILLLSTLLRLAFLHEPFERDEGQYAAIAQTILRGGLPYRDAIEIKPPGTFYLYALAIGLFGASLEAIRVFTALYALLTLFCVFGVTRQIGGVRAGLWGALVYGVYSTFPLLQGSSSNTEVFLVLPLMVGTWYFLRAHETGRSCYLAWCGLCGALAMLIKQVALPLIAVELLLIPFIPVTAGRFKSRLVQFSAFLAPMALLALATIGYFNLRGGLDDFLYWTVEFPRNYRGSEASGPSLWFALQYLAPSLLLPALVGVPAAIWLAVTKPELPGRLPLLMIIAASLAIVLPGKNFPHYFILAVPFFSVPAGIGLAHLVGMPWKRSSLALLAVATLFGFSIWKTYPYYTIYTPEAVSVQKYGTTLFADSTQVARYLKEHTRPDDYIFQWGFEPELYFLADRRCPNPFLVSLLPGWSKDTRQATDQLVRSLLAAKPAYIVVQPDWTNFLGDDQISRYLDIKCREEANIAYAIIFRCR